MDSSGNRLLLVVAALLAACALLAGAAAAHPGSLPSAAHATLKPAALSTDQWLSDAIGAPVHCYPSLASYFADSRIAPTNFWVGIAGFWGYATSFGKPIVGLTPNTCANLLSLDSTDRWPNDYAVFLLAHEQAHALGLDFAYATAHAQDPVFTGQVAAIENATDLSPAQATIEAGADCKGASDMSRIAYALGLRGSARFADLLKQAKLVSGYVRIPQACWPS